MIWSRVTRLLVLLLVTLPLVGAGCLAPLHKPPAAGSPASTLKFRIHHHHYPGGRLQFRLWIDGKQLPHWAPPSGPSGTWTRAKPGWRRLDLGSTFLTSRTVPQTYTSSESYRCGSSTCYRSVTRTRYVVQYSYLGVCRTALAVFLQQGRTYLIGYSYLGTGNCALTCHRQVFTDGEQFLLEPCPYAQAVRSAL